MMDKITDVSFSELTESRYIHPFRIHYSQNGVKKAWDCINIHDSVSILIHNTDRDVFVFVKQFRPAVYNSFAKRNGATDSKIDTDQVPGSLGLTYELCAGIIDKDMSFRDTAKLEVMEECGYDVPIENFRKISKFMSGVGTSASVQEMYYANVTDVMKTGSGGGNPEEGEMIDLVEVSVDESLDFVMNEDNVTPVGMMFAVMWYLRNKETLKQTFKE